MKRMYMVCVSVCVWIVSASLSPAQEPMKESAPQAGPNAEETLTALTQSSLFAECPPPGFQDDRAVTAIPKFEKRGSGALPMVLVPDVSSDSTVWESFMDRNGERYTMYALVLPGFGGTEAPPLDSRDTYESVPASLNAERAIIRFIEDQKLGKAWLMGHGYGGQIGLRVALARPDLVSGVVSVGGMPVVPMDDPSRDPSFIERMDIIRRTILPQALRVPEETWRNQQFMNAQALVSDDNRARELAEMVTKSDRGVSLHYFLESLLLDVRPHLGKLSVPTLFIAPLTPDLGPKERVARDQWKRIVGAPPRTTLAFYEDCRHFVMDDNPAQLDIDVDLFVRGKAIPGSFRTAGP